MEKLHHDLWLTHAVNGIFGPVAAAILRAFGRHVPEGAAVIPDYLAMIIVITLALTAFSLFVRAQLSVDNPGALQVLLEDFIGFFNGQLDDFVGPKGRVYLPIVGSMFLLIWISNLAGLVPGLMAPTTSLNVTLGCALTVWVFYHLEGVREQGIVSYLKHFILLPGAPKWMIVMAPIVVIIEVIGHCARVLSLSLRLFGNLFSEELVILILASLVPFIVPLPIMVLGLLTATLQALIFAILTMVYLGGAVAVEHHDDEAHH
jgi:F-type H+-transporting ATPase subunit a